MELKGLFVLCCMYTYAWRFSSAVAVVVAVIIIIVILFFFGKAAQREEDEKKSWNVMTQHRENPARIKLLSVWNEKK